jgi:NADH-quinone oxidoreductase subunit M
MILAWLLIIPFAGGILSWIAARWNELWARYISLITLVVDFALVLMLWPGYAWLGQTGVWIARIKTSWIPQAGIGFHLAMDGLSLLLVGLSVVLGIVGVLASWREIRERVGFFHLNLMWVLTGIIGVFLSMDMFLFYFFWELMLVPMYLLIGIWGHEKRVYAAIKFFLFTQASGLLMLIAILGLVFVHGRQTGVYTFDYFQLLGTRLPYQLSFWLMLGFFIAFAVKLPAVPVHSWLPDAHTEAPTAGSVILAGLLLKTGAYGLIRFVVPFFPEASAAFTPWAMTIAVISILYGAVLAFAQTDLKRLVADTSISHMGFVLLGVYSWNQLALQGAVVQMISHGISTGMLFFLVGALQERIHTRDMEQMGGLWSVAPRMGGVAMLFAMASLGLPGTGNFIGEFLVLLGAYQSGPAYSVIAAMGLVAATIYSLWLMQRVFFGEARSPHRFPDLGGREVFVSAIMVIAIVWVGLYPRGVLGKAGPALDGILGKTAAAAKAGPVQSAQAFLAGMEADSHGSR